MRTAARPYIWIIISDYAHGPLDEREILMTAVSAAGGKVVVTRATADAVLFRVRFPPDLDR
jgi:bifunctional ADP-heptose synthase (sugar kinase/adenylyltransferase)